MELMQECGRQERTNSCGLGLLFAVSLEERPVDAKPCSLL